MVTLLTAHLAALARDECPPCSGGVESSCGGVTVQPHWEEGLLFRGNTPPPNPRGEPCAWVPDRDDAAKDKVACSARAEGVVRAWIPDLPQSASMVWVEGLDVTAVWGIPVRHWSEASMRTRDPRESRDGERCTVRTVVGLDGVPLVAAARCGSSLHEELALARRYCVCDSGPIAMDLYITARSP